MKTEGEFLLGMDSIAILNNCLDSIPEKYQQLYRETKNNANNTLSEVLEASASIVHGIGMLLLHFYLKMYRLY